MSDRAETQVRAYPMPCWDDLPAALQDQIARNDAAIHRLPSTGRALVIDSAEATEGLEEYLELICALHGHGINVFARNLDGVQIVARRGFWPAGGDPRICRIDSTTREPLIAVSTLEDAVNDGTACEELLERFREPDLPVGLLELEQFDRRPYAAGLARFRGVFADGYTAQDIDRVLAEVTIEIGVELRCVWEYVDRDGPGGDSSIIAVIGGQARELPDGLEQLLHAGERDQVIDGATVPERPHPDISLRATCRWRSRRGYSIALEDRR